MTTFGIRWVELGSETNRKEARKLYVEFMSEESRTSVKI
jgi:hypothetical protein